MRKISIEILLAGKLFLFCFSFVVLYLVVVFLFLVPNFFCKADQKIIDQQLVLDNIGH